MQILFYACLILCFFLLYIYMRRMCISLSILFLAYTGAYATTRDAQLTNTTPYNYNYMYPYMNNNMRTNLNPGVTPSQSSNLIDTVVKTTNIGPGRRVVPRPTQNTSRNATNISTGRSAAYTGTNGRRVVARSAMRNNTPAPRTGTNGRSVVARSGTAREISTPTINSNTIRVSTSERMSSAQCMANYTECMNKYCERPKTAYNRCYCSSKLSQIDAMYQPEIESLFEQILKLKNTDTWSESEFNEYWMSTVGKYTNDNSWTDIDEALDINWADTESRVRGQVTFNTGHEYCVQYLRGCAYMQTNLRDAYRSQISRDCATYEQSLQKIRDIAESAISAYQE